MARTRHTRVASRSVLGKRRRAGNASRPFKRRRTSRRTTNFTSQAGAGGGIRFRSKKLSRARWRRLLWNTSLHLQHYRSLNATTGTFNTPATTITMTLSTTPALRFATQNFYVAGGGAIAPDAAQALPTFTGKFIIRGGTIGVRLVNTYDVTDANRNTNHGMVYLIKTSANFALTNLPSSLPVGWDPSLIQDFSTNIGRIVYRKNFLLRDADTALIEYRLKCQQVDPGEYILDKNTYVWVVVAGNVDAASARVFTYTAFYNISFSADAV